MKRSDFLQRIREIKGGGDLKPLLIYEFSHKDEDFFENDELLTDFLDGLELVIDDLEKVVLGDDSLNVVGELPPFLNKYTAKLYAEVVAFDMLSNAKLPVPPTFAVKVKARTGEVFLYHKALFDKQYRLEQGFAVTLVPNDGGVEVAQVKLELDLY